MFLARRQATLVRNRKRLKKLEYFLREPGTLSIGRWPVITGWQRSTRSRDNQPLTIIASSSQASRYRLSQQDRWIRGGAQHSSRKTAPGLHAKTRDIMHEKASLSVRKKVEAARVRCGINLRHRRPMEARQARSAYLEGWIARPQSPIGREHREVRGPGRPVDATQLE